MPRILVAEDDAALTQVFSERIAEFVVNAEIVTVASVGDAIRALEQRDYDLLWLDIILEGGTAWQILEDGLANDWLPANIVLCSGRIEIEKRHRELCMELWRLPGLRLYVQQKPVITDDIRRIMREVFPGD